MKFKEGDVVIAPYTWKDDEGKIKFKFRPAVVYQIESDTEHLMIKCTHVNRSSKFPGKWVLSESEEGKVMGLDVDTFIHYSETLIIDEKYCKLIGHCPYLNEIIDYHE